jgi:hypothetical protein
MQIGTVKRRPKVFQTICFRRFHGTPARGFTSCGPDENRTRHDFPAREFRLPWYMPAQKQTVEEIILYKNPKPFHRPTALFYAVPGQSHWWTNHLEFLCPAYIPWKGTTSVPLSLLLVDPEGVEPSAFL